MGEAYQQASLSAPAFKHGTQPSEVYQRISLAESTPGSISTELRRSVLPYTHARKPKTTCSVSPNKSPSLLEDATKQKTTKTHHFTMKKCKTHWTCSDESPGYKHQSPSWGHLSNSNQASHPPFHPSHTASKSFPLAPAVAPRAFALPLDLQGAPHHPSGSGTDLRVWSPVAHRPHQPQMDANGWLFIIHGGCRM